MLRAFRFQCDDADLRHAMRAARAIRRYYFYAIKIFAAGATLMRACLPPCHMFLFADAAHNMIFFARHYCLMRATRRFLLCARALLIRAIYVFKDIVATMPAADFSSSR